MTSVLKVTEACVWKSTLGLTAKGRVGKKTTQNKQTKKLCRCSIYIFIPSHISFKLKLLTHIVILSYHQEKKKQNRAFIIFF